MYTCAQGWNVVILGARPLGPLCCQFCEGHQGHCGLLADIFQGQKAKLRGHEAMALMALVKFLPCFLSSLIG